MTWEKALNQKECLENGKSFHPMVLQILESRGFLWFRKSFVKNKLFKSLFRVRVWAWSPWFPARDPQVRKKQLSLTGVLLAALPWREFLGLYVSRLCPYLAFLQLFPYRRNRLPQLFVRKKAIEETPEAAMSRLGCVDGLGTVAGSLWKGDPWG